MAFHAQDDLWFKRMEDGSVHVKWHERTTILTPESWASVVASMSAAGETAETWREALQRQVVPLDVFLAARDEHSDPEFRDELDAEIAESMKDPEYAAARRAAIGRDALIAGLDEEPQPMTLSHDRLILQRAERNGGQVVVVRCPHTIGLCFLTDHGGAVGEMLGVLPCPCNDRSEIVARIVPEVHDCATCSDCLHDGHKCCGCYDGVCCKAEAGDPS